LFFAVHGVSPVIGISSVCGTAYICRSDPSDPKPLNFDAYVFVVGTSSMLQVKKIPPTNLDYHWANNFPEFMKESVPQGIKDRVQEVISLVKNRP
jgi:hypothetical protein